jgi:hypothetical protein
LYGPRFESSITVFGDFTGYITLMKQAKMTVRLEVFRSEITEHYPTLKGVRIEV